MDIDSVFHLSVQGNASLPKGCLSRRYESGALFITYSLLIQASAAFRLYVTCPRLCCCLCEVLL